MSNLSLPISSAAKLPTLAGQADLSRLTDENLVECLKAGNSEAMAHLFDRYYATVRGIALKMLRNAEDAADVVQESFLDLHQNVRSFDPAKGSLRAWLSCLTYHRCLKKLRFLQSKGCPSSNELDVSSVLDCKVRPEEWIRSLDFRKCLDKALKTVNEKQRRTLLMYFFEGKDLCVIAEAIGESLGNTRHHLYRGLAKVRAELVQNRLLEGYIEFGIVERRKKAAG